MTALSLDDVTDLYRARGQRRYGEDVTQIEHALQCASLAEAAGAAPAGIVAALLHDIGHLLNHADEVTEFAVDGGHEVAGAAALAALFDATVCAPIAMHVAAKRYLCFADPSYLLGLSAASRQSLVLQGGAFDAAQAIAFERAPGWRDAVALRRVDDIGKVSRSAPRRFADYLPMMHRLLRDNPDR